MLNKPVVFLVVENQAILRVLPPALRRQGPEVREFASAAAFLESYADSPGCLVLDLSVPGMTGSELLQELTGRSQHIPVIFLMSPGELQQSVHVQRGRWVDFLQKPFLPEALLECIELALSEDYELRSRSLRDRDMRSLFNRLTEREHDVFSLLVESDNIPSSKEMARTLGISHRTVEHHRSRMLEKTRTGSVAELLALAREVGFGFPESD